jgi:hypothetical protein
MRLVSAAARLENTRVWKNVGGTTVTELISEVVVDDRIAKLLHSPDREASLGHSSFALVLRPLRVHGDGDLPVKDRIGQKPDAPDTGGPSAG